MANKHLVSFIIPYFNAGNTIKETLDSIFSQSYPNYDIWIVDDGSDDPDSINVLKEFESYDNISILRQKNAGPGIARNKAIEKTTAEFILPLDADDKIGHDSIKKALSYFSKNQNLGAVYGGFARFGAQKKHVLFRKKNDLNQQLLKNQIPVTALIKKEVFQTCGYYDEFLSKPGLEDWEFWIRVLNSNWEVIKIKEYIFFEARINNDSRTFQVANKNLDMIRKHIVVKHAELYYKVLEEKNLEIKMLKQTPDYKTGKTILAPYRFIKKLFKP